MKTFFTAIAIFTVSVTFSSEKFTIIKDENPLKILTPSMEGRKTLKIKLENGLNALIISDPGIDKSAAALCVEAGSWDDPKKYPGTAHFLEHMLFMGTAKYPKENEYDQFIYDNEGLLNAYTSTDRTVYMFSINNNAFLGALDRFAQFFISPLLTPSGIERELLAIDQENDKNIENDDWREWMIFKELGNIDHPNHKFSTGNAQTIGRIPHSILKQWFESHYSSQHMHLVIYSTKPLQELAQVVGETFGKIPQRSKPIKTRMPLLSDKQLGAMAYIKPIRNIKQLSLTWELPDEISNDNKHAPTTLIALAIEDKGKGSIYETLKNAQLIEDISASEETIAKKQKLFSIDIELTNEGVKKRQVIIETIFQLLARIKSEGIPKHVFDEYVKMQILTYQYQSRMNAFHYVSGVCHAMVEQPLNIFPYETLYPKQFSKKSITNTANSLNATQCYFSLIADPSLTNVEPSQKEQWLGGEYTLLALDQKFLEHLDSIAINKNILLPEKNPYLPNELTIHQTSPTNKYHAPPKLLKENDLACVFLKKENPYQTPKGEAIIGIKSAAINGQAGNYVCLDLFLKLFSQFHRQSLYLAGRAGLHTNFSRHPYKLIINISGYNDKFLDLHSNLFANIKSYRPSLDEFKVAKELLIDEYDKASKGLPVSQGIQKLYSVIFDDAYVHEDLKQLATSLSYSDFITFCESLFENVYIEMYISGNLTENDAHKIYQNTVTNLHARPLDYPEEYKRKILRLSSGENAYVLNLTSALQGDATLLMLQSSAFSYLNDAANDILSTAIGEAFHDTLRTKQQTGYIAQGFGIEKSGQLLLLFAVQSTSHSCNELLARFDLFLEEYLRNIQTHISNDRFEKLKTAAIDSLLIPAKNLSSLSALQYGQAYVYGRQFDRVQKQIEALKGLSYAQFLQYCSNAISRVNHKRIAVLVNGKNAKDHALSYQVINEDNLKKRGTFISGY